MLSLPLVAQDQVRQRQDQVFLGWSRISRYIAVRQTFPSMSQPCCQALALNRLESCALTPRQAVGRQRLAA